MFIGYEIKILVTLTIVCINFKLIYKDNIKKTIISYIFIYLILILLEIITTNIITSVGIINQYTPENSLTILKIILSISVGCLEYIIFSFNVINKFFRKLMDFFLQKFNHINIAYLMFITIALLGILNVNNFANDNTTKFIFLLILIFTILFIVVIKSKTKEEYLIKSNKKLVEFNEKYGQFLDEYKIYKHNINHKLAGMKAFGNKKINALIDDLLNEETNFSLKNNNLYNIPNGIKGIVAEKLYNADLNVIVNCKLKKDPFINLNPQEFNSISEAIGICLDNAIEATNNVKEPIITLDIDEDNDNLKIKIGNNFSNNIDIDKLGNKYYSTKNRGSGLGLFSIKQNNLIKEKISIINNMYYIELKLKKHE
jgi:hypothetical protein